MKKILILIPALVFIFSCKKKELPIEKHDPGDVITSSVNLESNYKWQIYFDLKTNTVVGQNLKSIWDLGFECGTNGSHIVLNTSKFMFVYNTHQTNFSAVTDTIGFAINKTWDLPNGDFDSTAIGNWQGNNEVYIIDRGFNEVGTHQGFRKIQFQSVDATSYTVRFSALNGNGDVTLQINKDDNFNFTFLSFSTSNTITVEPPKETWDLVFTQYTHIFHNPTEPYLVTGCLINRSNTSAVVDSSTAFTQITYDKIPNYTLKTDVDAIGYNWKSYSGSSYSIKYHVNYLIRDRDDIYYKLHFIDYYSPGGLTGSPKWEYQKL